MAVVVEDPTAVEGVRMAAGAAALIAVVAAALIAAEAAVHIAAAAGAWVRRLLGVLEVVQLAVVSVMARADQRVLTLRRTVNGIRSAARDPERDRQPEPAIALAIPRAHRAVREIPRMPMAGGSRSVAAAVPAAQVGHRVGRGRSDDREQAPETRRARIHLALVPLVRLRADLVRAQDREWAAAPLASRVEGHQLH